MRGVVSRSTSPAVSGVSDGLRRISVALASFEAVDDNRMTGRNPKGPFDVPAFRADSFRDTREILERSGEVIDRASGGCCP